MAVFGSRNRGNVQTYKAKYSKPLGKIYIANGGNQDEVASILKSIPDDVKREGFTERTSKDLRAQMDAVGGLYSSSLEGKLIHFGVNKNKDAKGIEREYVSVGIRTEVPQGGVNKPDAQPKEAVVFLSIALRSDMGMNIVHKMVNAKFGEETKLSMFAQMGEMKGDRQYANHTVGMSQNGEKVEAVYPLSLDDKKALREKGKAEGDDNQDIAKAILKAEYNATLPQIEVIKQRYEAYEEERKAEHAEEATATHAASATAAEDDGETDGQAEDLGFLEGDDKQEAPLPSLDEVAGADW